jgi:hypothetical protein
MMMLAERTATAGEESAGKNDRNGKVESDATTAHGFTPCVEPGTFAGCTPGQSEGLRSAKTETKSSRKGAKKSVKMAL